MICSLFCSCGRYFFCIYFSTIWQIRIPCDGGKQQEPYQNDKNKINFTAWWTNQISVLRSCVLLLHKTCRRANCSCLLLRGVFFFFCQGAHAGPSRARRADVVHRRGICCSKGAIRLGCGKRRSGKSVTAERMCVIACDFVVCRFEAFSGARTFFTTTGRYAEEEIISPSSCSSSPCYTFFFFSLSLPLLC